MTAEDLAGYRPVVREPLWGSFRDLRIATMPLPSSGGIALLETLGILQATGRDLTALGAGSSAELHLLAEIEKHAFADRARFLGDAEPARLAGGALLDPARLAAIAARIDMNKVKPLPTYGSQLPREPGGTSHMCVIDAEGNGVALTTTVNGYFGSKLMTRGGITLNNQVDDFTIAPGVANMFGLVQSEYNKVGPGKRPLSSMSPTLVFRGKQLVGCLGGSGGPRIISNSLQVFLDMFVFGMDARAAVSLPRVHHQWQPDETVVDADLAADVVDGLARRGHHVVREDWHSNPTAVQAIRVLADGTLEAASDPRKGGEPAAP
jgi:gamma-glutamyltranspeptidase/glutathione hydrolase